MLSWQGLPAELRTEYAVVRILKRTEQKEHLLLEHLQDGTRRLLCSYCGEPLSVYTLLLNRHLPHLPHIYAIYLRENGYSILQQFVEGSAPQLPTDTAPAHAEVVLSDIHQLCDALAALHALGIVHRDVKPENILKTSDGTLYLVDFDAARQYKAYVDNDTCLMGTTGYAAPEQFGILQTDRRADIFALGVTLNVLLTGCHPSQLLCKGPLRKIILRCTRIDPDDRYQTTQAVWNALAPYYTLAQIKHGIVPHFSRKSIAILAFSSCFLFLCAYLVVNREALFFHAIPAVAQSETVAVSGASGASNADVSHSVQSESVSHGEKPVFEKNSPPKTNNISHENNTPLHTTTYLPGGNGYQKPYIPFYGSSGSGSASGSGSLSGGNSPSGSTSVTPDKPPASSGKPTPPPASSGKPTPPPASSGKPTPPPASSDKPTPPPASSVKPTPPPVSSSTVDVTQKTGYAEVKAAVDNYHSRKADAQQADAEAQAAYTLHENGIGVQYTYYMDLASAARYEAEKAAMDTVAAQNLLNSLLAAVPQNPGAIAQAQTALAQAQTIQAGKQTACNDTEASFLAFEKSPEYQKSVQLVKNANFKKSGMDTLAKVALADARALQNKYKIYLI
ncbi:MAG: protein kinase [Ruthenibacterium sp.]